MEVPKVVAQGQVQPIGDRTLVLVQGRHHLREDASVFSHRGSSMIGLTFQDFGVHLGPKSSKIGCRLSKEGADFSTSTN
jgi:hypothetical protein